MSGDAEWSALCFGARLDQRPNGYSLEDDPLIPSSNHLTHQILFSRGIAYMTADTFKQGIKMHKNIYVVIFVVVLIVVIVSVDLLFFRHHFLERLMSNIGIVLVFAAFGLRFLKK
jgi:hypothetical protein